MSKITIQKTKELLFRNWRILFLAGLIFGFCTSGGYAEDLSDIYDLIDSSPEISMDFKDASLKDILKVFSIQAGINFIVSQEIEDLKVTVYLDKVSVREAMDKLFRANKLGYEFYEESNIILVKTAELEIATITKVFTLKHARVSTSSIQTDMYRIVATDEDEDEDGALSGGKWVAEEAAGITTVIKKLLSPVGTLAEDPRTNSLIITDLPKQFPIIEKTISELDIPVPQVMLDVEMLDVNKNLVDKFGFEFDAHPLSLFAPGGFVNKGAALFLGTLSKKGASINDAGAAGSVVFGNTYAGVLDLLRTQTDTKYLARPRILTLNNETAEIKIETDELIGLQPEFGGEYGTTVTGYEVERGKTGISLRVTPQVNLYTGEITMFIYPKVAEANLSVIQPETPLEGQTQYQDIEQRATKSLVKIRDGETVIVGGLIHKNEYVTIKKVPILGDIPFIGALFRHKNKDRDIERELLVFITPHIVKDTFLQQGNDVILSSREQRSPSEEMRLLKINTTLDSLNVTNNTQTQR